MTFHFDGHVHLLTLSGAKQHETQYSYVAQHPLGSHVSQLCFVVRWCFVSQHPPVSILPRPQT